MKKITIGILAHVDAGKTTLSEAFLYLTGKIRKLGRVDHQDSFLDNFLLERNRGITIFSKQANFTVGDTEFTLVDTPGHVDFSAETERTLKILDYAVLVISGADGVQGHTKTLWKLLSVYKIPTFLFVNKMDQDGTDREKLLAGIQKELSDNCVPFDQEKGGDWYESLAMSDEDALEEFLEEGVISGERIQRLIADREVFPVYFGSALKLEGVEDFLSQMNQLMVAQDYPDDFSARVYKISRDDQGTRLTHIKMTGGSLAVKSVFESGEKIDQIRIYNGQKYELVQEVEAGQVCAVTGPNETYAGQGLGKEQDSKAPVLEPIFSYEIILPEGSDVSKALGYFRQLEEEEPELHISWNPTTQEISAQLMGEVQTEILKNMVEERFGLAIDFGPGRVMYKETIKEPVIGVGHYEPLRHYAEVHLRMEPLPAGSGLVFDTDCSEDTLSRNWQRLILTHLGEKEHLGVLTGSPITDMKITLIAGRAHQKHTEGGDFRQATYRAVRQGLKKAESLLLEPWLKFELEVPAGMIGRAMTDIGSLSGTFESPEIMEDQGVLRGEAPASTLMPYQTEVWSYTKGRGRIRLSNAGYRPCHNAEEVLAGIEYDSERDLDNPTGSVFCAHGAGYLVPWDQVEDKMHIKDVKEITEPINLPERRTTRREHVNAFGDDAELLAIMEREFGKSKERQDRYSGYRKQTFSDQKPKAKPLYSRKKKSENKEQYLLVDGYNVIFAWDDLRELSERSIDAARSKLIDILCNYQGYVGCTLICVFDAYKVKGNPGEIYKDRNIYVVYTKEAETADSYIEKTTHQIAKENHVTVATSDGLEQVIVMGNGAYRISSRDFEQEVLRVEQEIAEVSFQKGVRENREHNYLFDHMDDEMQKQMEEIRLKDSRQNVDKKG